MMHMRFERDDPLPGILKRTLLIAYKYPDANHNKRKEELAEMSQNKKRKTESTDANHHKRKEELAEMSLNKKRKTESIVHLDDSDFSIEVFDVWSASPSPKPSID
jgi:hypothetical protein